jgi:hypothetical protein
VIHVLDVAEVGDADVENFLRILVDEYIPAAMGRGLRLQGCWRTAAESGEPAVVTLWAVDGWEAWARARSLASQDPTVADCARRLRALSTAAQRRFLVPVAKTAGDALSPPRA